MDDVPLIALEREWRTLVRRRLAVAYRRWKATEPVLAAFDGPERLLAFLWNEEAPAEVQDRALGALLLLAQTEPLASRFILQALLPGLKARAGQLLRPRRGREHEQSSLDRGDLWQVLFVELLERIRTYPLERRPRKIAINLLLDTVHVAYGELGRARRFLRDVPMDEPLEPPAPGEVPTDVDDVLARAVAAGVITAGEAALIARTLTVAEVEAAIRARYGRPDPGDGGGSAAPDAGPPSGPPSSPPPEGGPHIRSGGHDDAESGGSEKSDKDELTHDEDEPRAAA